MVLASLERLGGTPPPDRAHEMHHRRPGRQRQGTIEPSVVGVRQRLTATEGAARS
jgi:hypothetical protein